MAERALSVFCDESGDFGEYESHSPYYLLTLVLHEQDRPIARNIQRLSEALSVESVVGAEPIHTAPLIRREKPYKDLDLRVRRRLFSHIEHFARKCPIRTKTILVNKWDFGGGKGLSERLARELGALLRDRQAYFQSFDRVIVYYDEGQRQISSTLRIIFSAMLTNVEFRTVRPCDYRLFQVADLVCTLELLSHKLDRKELTKSELDFFDGQRNLRRNHLRMLDRMRC